MTYCVGILVKEGLTMIADTRTNAASTTSLNTASSTCSSVPATA